MATKYRSDRTVGQPRLRGERADSPRGPLSDVHIGRVYRALADEHAEQVNRVRQDATWQRIANKAMSQGKQWPVESWGDWVLGLTAGRVVPVAFASLVAVVSVAVWAILFLGDGVGFPASKASTFNFEVDGAAPSSQWVHAEDNEVGLRFSDGSLVRLEPRSAVSVALGAEHQAKVRVSEGTLSASVKHADTTDWRFLAGPYEVRVLGTRFDLAWAEGRFRLQMHEGQVEVSGPGGQVWHAGDQQLLELGLLPDEAPQREPDGSAEQTQEGVVDLYDGQQLDEVAFAIDTPSKPLLSGSTQRRGSSWPDKLAAGKFDFILQEASAQGIDHALARRSAAELRALAQAARYAKRPELAERVWTMVQRRFARSALANEAGFFLGRVAEQRGQVSSALRQYRAYLKSGSGARYSAEAQGGLMRLLRTQDRPAAEAVAHRYLASHPNGPYARLAHELVGTSPAAK